MGLLNKFRKEGKKKRVEEEILQNLNSLLNTKQNYGAWQEGMGLSPSLGGSSSVGLINKIISDIHSNVSRFEKRIQIIRIHLIHPNEPFHLQFQIDCKTSKQFHSFYLGFNNYSQSMAIEEGHHERDR